ncbi:MAG: acyloxyacyl hydrolase, partial [Candidatus Binatia bacterium]
MATFKQRNTYWATAYLFGRLKKNNLAPKRAVTLGYKLHHMSNANTHRSNPGMDSHVIYA